MLSQLAETDCSPGAQFAFGRRLTDALLCCMGTLPHARQQVLHWYQAHTFVSTAQRLFRPGDSGTLSNAELSLAADCVLDELRQRFAFSLRLQPSGVWSPTRDLFQGR